MSNMGYEEVMGRHGLRGTKENGQRFANLCVFNKMVLGGTIFPDKPIHKATLASQYHTAENQVYHICINKKNSGQWKT